jgi:hypothetical protein
MDVNSDGIYDPMAGDYPLIKGDQAIYTIFNDSYLPHGSGGQAIGLEIRLMAYAYGTGTLVANNPFLNYTTFYDYTIINRSSFALYDSYMGLFNDSDISNRDLEDLFKVNYKVITKEQVSEFNAHLRLERKEHKTYSEWVRHLKNWLPLRPKKEENKPNLTQKRLDK